MARIAATLARDPRRVVSRLRRRPASPPSVAACYTERYAGRLSLHDAQGRATFAASLLRAGIEP